MRPFRRILVFSIIFSILFCLVSCSKNEQVAQEPTQNPKVYTKSWSNKNDEAGVSMGIKDVSSTGLTIVYTGYSDDMSNKSISYGPDYSLFMKDGDHWVQAPMYAESTFHSIIEGYIIEGESEQKIDWEWLYGSLEPGTYCIEKSLCNQGKHVYISKEDIFQLGVEFIIE